MRGQLDLTINHWGLTGFDHQNTEVIFENWWLLWWYFDIFWWLNPNDNHENCWLIIIGGHWLTSFIWNFTKRTHELGIPNFTKQCVYVYLGMTSWLLRTAPKAPRAEKNVVYPENMLELLWRHGLRLSNVIFIGLNVGWTLRDMRAQ